MSENRYAQRIPESRWQFHRTTIYRLYVLENKPLTASDGVKDIMFTRHGFSATKAQYETRLKKWGFYKYTSAHDRRNRTSILHNRRAEGRDTDRPTWDLWDEIPTETRSPLRDIVFRTSSPQRSALQPPSFCLPSPGISSSALAGGWQDIESFSMDSATFQSPISHHQIGPFTSQNQSCALNSSLVANGMFDLARPILTNKTVTAASRAFHHRELSRNSSSPSVFPHETNVSNLVERNDSGPSTSNGFLAGLSQSATILLSEFSAPDFATSIMPIISRMFPKGGSSAPVIFLGDSSVFESAISNIYRSSTSQLIRQLGIDHQFIYMIFHQLVNDGNAAQVLDEPHEKLDHFFKIGITYCFSLGKEVLVSIFNATPSPYDVPLLQNMFCAALILGDGPVLNIIMELDRGSFVNRPVLLGDRHYYPLEYTSIRGYVQATQVLLDHGADPNRQKTQRYLHDIGRIPWTQGENTEVRVQIMRMLIDRGLEVDPDFSRYGLNRCDKDELLILAIHWLSKSFETFFHHRALPKLLLHPACDDSFSKTLKAILDQACSESIGRQDLWNSVLSESLSSAVLRNHASAVDILLAMGAIPDVHCLISAVQSNDLKIVEDFLDHGLDPNAQISLPNKRSIEYDYGRDYSRNYGRDYAATALSEAIKNRSRGALQVLQARGFVSKLANQPVGFVPALTAACQVGDSTLVDQLLSLPNFPRRQATIFKAIEAATTENQEHVIEKLLSVGIKPSKGCLVIAIQKKQLATVKLLASCMDLHGVLQYYEHDESWERMYRYDNAIIMEALRWGDQTAIEHVLGIGHPVNVVTELTYGHHDWILLPSWVPLPDLYPPGARDRWNYTPLSAAILERNATAVKALMAHGAQAGLFNSRLTSYQSSVSFHPASDESAWILTPLAAAAIRNNIPLVEEFLRQSVDPFDNSAVFVCAVNNLEDIITLLLSAFKNRYPHGAQSFGSDALHHTIRCGNTRILGLLAKDTDVTGPVEDDQGPGSTSYLLTHTDTVFTSPLGEAIRLHVESDGTSGVLDLLLPLIKDHNAVVHKSFKRGNITSLLHAIFLDSLETVQKLHRAGANISLPAEWGITRTPLQAAAQAGSTDIVEYLLGQGVSPNEPPAPRAGATALQLAAITGNISIATVLLNAGAEINAPPAFCDGRTAFEGATEHGRIEMMIFLVRQGADLLSDNEAQYRRAVEFAGDNLQHAAKKLADELYEKSLANQGTNFIGMGGNAWAEADMGNFGDFLL